MHKKVVAVASSYKETKIWNKCNGKAAHIYGYSYTCLDIIYRTFCIRIFKKENKEIS